MKNFYTFKRKAFFLFAFLFLISSGHNEIYSQSFSQNNINFNGKGSLNNGTSLTFGPDGRLYVTEYTGSIKIFTIERVGPGNYSVISMEELIGIQSIQDYNDDGSLYSSTMRETIGIVVVGTAANPIVYVSSSDFRIGGGGGGGNGDVNLDTNSGIITRFSWNGTSWNVVDIVRGLPRSEENHATNGIEFATINGNDYLIVAQGGHTNAGGPSANFAYTTEYALSAAILSINLTMLEAMPILENNGRKYIYDLPTLDDPTRPNKNGITDPDASGYDGIDINDPFGGNDGLNQAMIVPGGPVKIFSPGYRNAYDLVVTENGAVYVTDNGANGGWGGFPVNEGGGSANNNYDPNEPGSTSSSGGEMVNNKDHLSLVTLDIQNYILGTFYGGHPTPVRANPFGAGLYTNPAVTGTNGAFFRTQIYDPNGSRTGSTTDPSKGLPANWPPVKVANPVEGDYRGPGDSNPDGPVDALVTIWGTNTNGIDEYTASNFEGAMKGNLLAGVNTGELRRVELNTNGSLKQLTTSFASGLGGDALGITCNGDIDIFPGTIWVATLNGLLVVLEPLDFVTCIGSNDPAYDPNADNDYDGYINKDEVDNGTDPCNGASQPSDFDKAAGAPLISDLNDTDDDNDGILDSADPLQLGDPLKTGSDAFDLPVNNELFSSNPNLKGYMGLGMTGLMNNAASNPNWLKWLDRRDDPDDPNPNDILGGAIGAMTMHMTSGTALGTKNNQEKGFQFGVKVSQATGKFTVSGGIMNFKAPLQLYGHPQAPDGELGFFIGDGTQSNYVKFVITKNGLLALQEINDVPSTPIKFSVPETSRPDAGITFYFNVDPSNGIISLDYSFDNGPIGNLGTLTAQGAVLQAIQQSTKDLAVGFIGTSNSAGIELEGTWDYLKVSGNNPPSDSQVVLYRINSGGPGIQAIDGKINWGADTGTYNSPNLSLAGSNTTSGFSMTGYSASVNQSTTPVSIFNTERYDGVAGPPNMTYAFPVSTSGNYIVRLYMGNGWEGTSSPGQRIFDAAIEGFVHPSMNDIDLSSLFGHAKGGMITQTVEVTDGVLNISFIHGVENPLINGIEILSTSQSNNPIQIVQLVDQTSIAGKQLDGSLVVQASGGDGNLSYSILGAPAGVVIEPTNGQIGGTIDINAHLNSPYTVTVKVDDNDETASDAVSMQFKWYITSDDQVQTTNVLYRVNTGGPFIGAIDGKMDWSADTGTNNSPNLSVAGSNTTSGFSMTGYSASVNQNTTPVGIFNTERYDAVAGPPNMTYAFPVSTSGNYIVRLYMGNGWEGTSFPGQRIFDVAIEGFVHPSMNDIDLSSLFGHAKGGMITQTVEITDGVLNISFIHGVENPLINGIEILSTSSTSNIQLTQIPNQSNYEGQVLNGSLKASATGGDGALKYAMTGAPSGVVIDAVTGVISGTIALDADIASPYNVIVTVDDSDDQTADAVTTTFTWTVTSNQLPSVAITAPIENAAFTTPVDITIDATASDTDGTIAKVEFFQGTTKLEEDLDGSNGWSYAWINVPPNTYSLTAIATDDKGASTTSAVVNITVSGPANSAPSVAITSPLENATFTTPVDITIDATASDTDGTVTKVEFFQGTTKLGEDLDGSNGWNYSWNNVAPSIYTLTAVATDDKGAATTSAAVNITVLNPPSPVITSFSPTSGSIGTLVTINGNNFANATSVTFGPSSAQIMSNTDTKIEALVPFVNGKLPSKVKITVTTTGGNNTSLNRFTITAGTVPVNAVPIVTINTPVNNENFSAPASIGITASASDPDGTVVKVEFFNGTLKLGEDLTSPYAFNWNNVATGNYVLTAKVTDDKGAVTTSEVVNISVSSTNNTAPVVNITSPANNSNFTSSASIGITASASDSDGTVVKVEFFNGVTKLGEDLTNPYSFTWNNVATGNYSLTAKATDDKGAVSTSAIVNITVGAASEVAAPSNLFAEWATSSQVNLYWQDNSFDEDGFVLERAYKADFTGKVDIINLSANTISYQDSNLNTNRAVYYRIKAVRGSLSSAYSNIASPAALKAMETSDKEAQASLYDEEPAMEESINIKMYPNPANAEVYLQTPNPSVKINAVAMYDYNGKYIRTFTTGNDLTYEGAERYSFTISGMPNGVYILKVTSENSGVFTLRLIKED